MYVSWVLLAGSCPENQVSQQRSKGRWGVVKIPAVMHVLEVMATVS